MNRRRICYVFLGIASIALGVTVLDVFTGGRTFAIGSLRLSSRDAFRPLVVLVVAGSAALWLSDSRREAPSNWERIARYSRPLAAGVAILTAAAGIHFGIFAAGGADAYGYVSEAMLLAAGHLKIVEPLARIAPPLGPGIAPLGYRLATTPGDIVPIYPPGFPLLMAIALRIAGSTAVYYIVPVLGGACVWLTFVLGARVSGARAGLFAAILLACSPIFLLQLIEPMSDVPATAFWLMSLSFALTTGNLAAILAGLAATGALLTRPNLLPLAIVAALATLIPERRLSRPLLFSAGLIPGFVTLAVLNASLYGSPFSFGAGPTDALFSWGSIGANLQRYPLWLVQVHSIFICLAIVAPFVQAGSVGAETTRIIWLLLAFFGVLSLCYLFYLPYDNWPFLRFLLPGVPILLVLSCGVAIHVVDRLPVMHRAATAVALFGLLAGWCLKNAADRNVFLTGASEARYIAVGQFVDRELPANAVLLSVIESGSVRLYGHRSSVRWDQLQGEQLEPTLNTLRANGYEPYLLLEDWEEPLFRERFAAASAIGSVDWPPAAEYRGHQRVRIYSPADRALARAGRPSADPKPIPSAIR